MKLHELAPAKGATKAPKRIGRGIGSGHGKTSCRGHNGQNSRSGGGTRPGFEGGQTPLYVRLPKRGFSNMMFAKVYSEVNVGDLNSFRAGSILTTEKLIEAGLAKPAKNGIKLMGDGDLKKRFTIKGMKLTKGAISKVEAAGGKIEEVK